MLSEEAERRGKTPPPSPLWYGLDQDPTWRRRFLREAEAASSLSHPNIIACHGAFRAGATLSIVLEYADAEASTWLAGALDFAWNAAPPALRDVIPVNATMPAEPCPP